MKRGKRILARGLFDGRQVKAAWENGRLTSDSKEFLAHVADLVAYGQPLDLRPCFSVIPSLASKTTAYWTLCAIFLDSGIPWSEQTGSVQTIGWSAPDAPSVDLV